MPAVTMDSQSPRHRLAEGLWQQEKDALARILANVSPGTKLVNKDGGIFSVPLEITSAVSRAIVICTEDRLEQNARWKIKTSIVEERSLGNERFDVVFRTGEMTAEFAQVIGAKRQWIAATWDQDTAPQAASPPRPKTQTKPKSQIPMPPGRAGSSMLPRPSTLPTPAKASAKPKVSMLPRLGQPKSAAEAAQAIQASTKSRLSRRS